MNVPEFPKKENVVTKPITLNSVSGNIRSIFIKMRKITLFDKYLPLEESVALLKSKLVHFSGHRFNIQHTSEVSAELLMTIQF